MSLPGFTAEASLYKTSENYKMDGTIGARAGDEKIVPQYAVCGPCNGYFKFCCLYDNSTGQLLYCAGGIPCWLPGF